VLAFATRGWPSFGVRSRWHPCRKPSTPGRAVEETGARASRNRLQTGVLLHAIEEHDFDAAFGGARRDEEKARAKERVFSFRDEFGQWDPKNQRPELWSLYNGRHRKGEHIRVFPLSNWTELDIWQYIAEEDIEIPALYYAHRRQVVRRDGMLMAINDLVPVRDGRSPSRRSSGTAPSATPPAPPPSSRRPRPSTT
jgi:sulfate adenylyltransferase subunit 2